MVMEDKMFQFWLWNLPKFGPKKIEYLLEIFNNSKEIFYADQKVLDQLLSQEGKMFNNPMNRKDIEVIVEHRNLDMLLREYTKMLDKGIYFVSKEDTRYPKKLREIYGAPYGLYVKGTLPLEHQKMIAIVGARESSLYGREMAHYFAREFAQANIAVVSGLARGIDTHAHWGTLQGAGKTYAILGCGVDICYPKENIELYMKMQEEGGIISEFPIGTNPYSSNFPMRNRIISGMCDGILVIEAKEKSGSLITVDMGLEQGKDIFALPGRATDRNSEGCNNLIRMGAQLVTRPSEVIAEFVPHYQDPAREDKKINNLLETKSKIVYSCLSLEPKHLEEILEETKIPFDTLVEQLLFLELQGFIKQTRTNYYKRT